MEPSDKEKQIGMLALLSPLLGYVLPFAHLIAPLVLWQTKKNESDYIAMHAKEVLNFQISVTIWAILCAILVVFLIGIPMLIALGIFQIVTMIMGALKARDGLEYRYPITIRFFK